MSYAIINADARTGNRLELCRLGSNPEAVAEGARPKTYVIGKRHLQAYGNVEVIAVAANERGTE